MFNTLIKTMNPVSHRQVIDSLLHSSEPSIRWKVLQNCLGESPDSGRMIRLREEIRRSPRVKALLLGHDRLGLPNIYAKWQGAHWILATLSDIGYPSGDRKLIPLRDRILDAWLAPNFLTEFNAKSKKEVYSKEGVPLMQGRYRRCASQQGNPLYFLARLGLENERSKELVERLLHWQWPDGGWNCDKDPSADTSSFMETLLPMLGLHLYARTHRDKAAAKASERAREVFLRRHLFRRVDNGKVMHREFVLLHYPLYWHYDILAGLKAMVLVGAIGDPRCNEALDLLEQKRLSDGGWPSESRYYAVEPDRIELHADYVDWGGTSIRKMNEWVTVDALHVLASAGRLRP